MGKRRHDSKELTALEKFFCCCKCRAECKTRLTQCFIYLFMSTFLISMAAACITIGVLNRENCSYNKMVPYWVISCSVTPLLLLFFIKAIKEKYVGVTCWRVVSLLGYGLFLGWLITGCVWVYNTWIYVTSTCYSCCDPVLNNTAFALTFIHWIFIIIASIPNFYIASKMLCCCTKNAIMPLKPDIPYNRQLEKDPRKRGYNFKF